MKHLSQAGAGLCVATGGAIQIISSSVWQTLNSETVYYLGQPLGELFYMIALRRFFTGIYKAVCEFLLSLIVVDIISILILDPTETSLPKYAGFVIAGIVLMARVGHYKASRNGNY